MRRLYALAVLASLSGWLLACTEPRSTACKEVCKREAECIDATASKVPFDEKECIAACAALEHDIEHSAAKVQRHVECVRAATATTTTTTAAGCKAVLECK